MKYHRIYNYKQKNNNNNISLLKEYQQLSKIMYLKFK